MSDQPVPTHINAYYADLQEAERELAQVQGKVAGLKETIATMEQADKVATGEAPATGEEATETAADESVEDLEKLKRPELEAEAKKAGVADPSAAANKHDLAEETVAAQADNVPASDAPSTTTNTVSDEPALNPPSAEPVSLPAGGDTTGAAPADSIVHPASTGVHEGDFPNPDVETPAEDVDEPAGAAATSEPQA